MTALMIYEAHCGRWKNNPTRNELSNYLGKSGYFEKVETDGPMERGGVHIWKLDREKCRRRGWFEVPMQNRHVNDPLPLRD